MSNINNWNKRWFGVWKETGTAYNACPSIKDFIDEKVSDVYDIKSLVTYLSSANVVTTTSRMSFPCVISGKVFGGSVSYRTDGKWLWLDDLAYYVSEHNVCIPDKMLKDIIANGYKAPVIENIDHTAFEWPPVSV